MKKLISTLFICFLLTTMFAVAGSGPEEAISSENKHDPVETAVLTETNKPGSAMDNPARQLDWEASSLPKFSAWRSIGSIIFIIGILLTANIYLKKKQGFALRTGEEKSMHLLEKLTIDSKRYLLLVETDSEEIVLGISPDKIDPISVRKKS